ncbi:MAG: lysophospholipid acyltransferase family protein [Desulfobacterales bacterium]
MTKDQYHQLLRSEFGYQTPPRRKVFGSFFPSWLNFIYYVRLVSIITHAGIVGRRGNLDDEKWAWFSHRIVKTVESVGGKVNISGLEALSHQSGPVVYIANHMSLLETLVLPGIALAFNRVNFVIKEELRHYPVAKHFMIALKLIAVSRQNPRDDLKVVMREGSKFISSGGSIFIFPQATRSVEFDVEGFNTLGIKLAARNGVPVVPVAVKTDFQQNGKWIKELGPIDPHKTIYFKFGEPLVVEGKGRQAHQDVIDFIVQNLLAWGGKIKENATSGH